MIGFDYGVKPSVMIVGDIQYPNLIHEGKPKAMGYGRLPHFGLLPNPLFAALIFENEEKGKECFKHFKAWADSSKDGDAVSLSFIERNEGGYVVCVYEEINRLINRRLPEYLRSEVSPLITTATSFPLTVEKPSDFFLVFKEEAKETPFLFGGAGRTGKLFPDLVIQKMEVQFYKEDEIPENTPESAYLNIKSAKEGQWKFERKQPGEEAEAIGGRRRRRLKMFHPITIEKIEYLPNYQETRDKLRAEEFADWQILQGLCNIAVSYRMCGKPYYEELTEETAQMDILKYLLNDFEEPKTPMPPESYISVEAIRKQIIADMIALLRNTGSEPKYKSKKALLKSLQRKGFLGENG